MRRAVAEGFETPAGVKKATRCGMGICQGSTCRTILAEVLAALTGRSVAQVPLPTVRMPLKPVFLGTLAGSGTLKAFPNVGSFSVERHLAAITIEAGRLSHI